MPRRKRAFINRSQAKTYQLVQRTSDNDGPQHVLLPVNQGTSSAVDELSASGNSAFGEVSRDGEILITDSQAEYKKNNFELGEFGFPDDGYDYSKHFKTIGGGGGVFMDAVTGRENPEAVSTAKKSQRGVEEKKNLDQVLLKEDINMEELNEEDEKPSEQWRNSVDDALRQEAIEEIKRERKYNKDLDEVFAALDSDGELESTSSDVGDKTSELDQDFSSLLQNLVEETEDEADLLEDDFIDLAAGKPEAEQEKDQYDRILKQYREPRLLDEQFDKFMQGYNIDDDDDYDEDDEEDEELRVQLEEKVNSSNYENEGLDSADLKLLWDQGLGDELAAELVTLHVDDEGDNLDCSSDKAHTESVQTASNTERQKEYEEFTNAEFERGMESLLQSFNRVTADEAFEALDGLDVAREAIARNEEDEKIQVDTKEELGLGDSDGHDSDLDTLFDDMYAEKGEKWDCETIISTYTNLENHPSIIDAPPSVKRRPMQRQPVIRLDPRTQAPADFVYQPDAMGSSSQAFDFGSQRDNQSGTSKREKGESKAEKKARKAAVREAARERRALKSEMRKAFGAETLKQSRHATALGKSKVAVKF